MTNTYRIHSIPNKEFSELIYRSVLYGVISIPFTYDRMGYQMDLERRITNIIKGKIAEECFNHFANSINIDIDTGYCQTPFYRIDKRDFLYQSIEWDIKNNFVLKSFESINLDRLPALVPVDQWAKRTEHKFSWTTGVNYCFTFMEKDSRNEPINLSLNDKQKGLLKSLYQKYLGKEQEKAPFTEEWFRHEFGEFTYNHKFTNRILIGGYSDNTLWRSFTEEQPHSFGDGAIITRIPNYCLELSRLLHF